MVEQYKETKYRNNKDRAVLKSISSLIWTATLILYFGLSLTTRNWGVTWILFLIAACVQKIIELVYELRHEEKYL